MPKEQINHYSNTMTQTGNPVASIHWDGPSEYAQLSLELDVDALAEYLADLKKSSPDDKRIPFYTPTLSRKELQTLISASKRARNAVFGADE